MLNFNCIIDLVALMVIGCVWITGIGKKKITREDQKVFVALLFAITLIFITDILGWLLDGRSFYGAGGLLLFSNTVYYVLQILYCYLWILFADCRNSGSRHIIRRHAILYALPLVIEFILIIINLWTGWIFVMESSNVYVRGDYFIVNLIPYYIYIAGAVGVTLKGILIVDKIHRRQKLSFLIFMFLPICGTILETCSYGVSWLWPFAALGLLMVYLDIQQQAFSDERIAIAKREQDAKVSIMLSQIQPHFLYNSLTAIGQLCEKDPKRAKKATVDFSAYLRANLDSLKQIGPVSFERELQHIITYLELEQMRFGDELKVVYDVQVKNFNLPSLTVQPLIENSVKYGVGEKKDGGTVTLSTRETEKSYIVIVEDDGVGFDIYTEQYDGRTHIGIDNVKSRLAFQCNGTLNIESRKGIGTKATIIIPKEDSPQL